MKNNKCNFISYTSYYFTSTAFAKLHRLLFASWLNRIVSIKQPKLFHTKYHPITFFINSLTKATDRAVAQCKSSTQLQQFLSILELMSFGESCNDRLTWEKFGQNSFTPTECTCTTHPIIYWENSTTQPLCCGQIIDMTLDLQPTNHKTVKGLTFWK